MTDGRTITVDYIQGELGSVLGAIKQQMGAVYTSINDHEFIKLFVLFFLLVVMVYEM